jgi:hypothetical protein
MCRDASSRCPAGPNCRSSSDLARTSSRRPSPTATRARPFRRDRTRFRSSRPAPLARSNNRANRCAYHVAEALSSRHHRRRLPDRFVTTRGRILDDRQETGKRCTDTNCRSSEREARLHQTQRTSRVRGARGGDGAAVRTSALRASERRVLRFRRYTIRYYRNRHQRKRRKPR